MHSSNPRPKNSLVLINVLSNYARFGIAILCTLVLTPIVVRDLGTEGFGLWTLLLCISGYLELFDLGLTAGAMRSIALMGFDQREQKNRLVNTLLVSSMAIAPFVLLAGAGIGVWLASPTDPNGPAIPWLISFVCLRVVMILPLGVLMGVLFGEHRIWLVNAIRAASIAIFTVAAIVAMATGHGILTLGFLYALIYTLEYVAYGILAIGLIPWLRLDVRQFDLGTLKSVLGFSTSSFTANASNVMLMRTDPLIITTFLSLGAVALYAVPMRIAEQLFSLSKQLINVFSPLFAQLYGSGRLDSVRSAYITCTKFSFGMMIGIVIPAMFYAEDALRFWIGDEFTASRGVLTVLLAAAVVRTLQESSANALVMTGKHYFVARVSTASAVANLALSMVLVRPLGITGVAWATLLSVALFGFLVTTLRACREYQIPLVKFVFQVLVPAIIPAIAQWLILVSLDGLRAPTGLGDLALYGSASLAGYVTAYRLTSLNAAERGVANHWLAETWRRTRIVMPTSSRNLDQRNTASPIQKEPC